jgi:pyrroline-5-carboxylate reductase
MVAMKKLHIACIGAGNMGSAFIRGLLRSRHFVPAQICAADLNENKLKQLATELKIRTRTDNVATVKNADVVLLAVKPQIIEKVLVELRGKLGPEVLVLSIAAGYPTGLIERVLKNQPHVVRAMPNIAATVGASATALCRGRYARRADLQLARRLFEFCGMVTEVDESLMDAVTGLSGSGPMYIFIIIEALSDAGVKVGLPRDQASALAIQTVLGSARMVQETKLHPIFLKDLVTSPGGTSINALYSIEKTGLRAVLMDAVETATRRSHELGRPYSANDQPE